MCSAARKRAMLKQIERGNHPDNTRPTREIIWDKPHSICLGIRYRQQLNARLKMKRETNDLDG